MGVGGDGCVLDEEFVCGGGVCGGCEVCVWGGGWVCGGVCVCVTVCVCVSVCVCV